MSATQHEPESRTSASRSLARGSWRRRPGGRPRAVPLAELTRVPGASRRTALPFAALTGIHLAAQVGVALGVPGASLVAPVTKTLLMPALGLVAAEGLVSARRRTGNLPSWWPAMAAAIGFSWLGDLALIDSDLFLVGVGAFGIAQATYVGIFLKAGGATRTAGRPALAAPYVAWWLGLLGFFGATQGFTPMTGAVAAYGVLLGSMAYTANRISVTAAVGAATFVLSDSLIGVAGAGGGEGLAIPFHGFLVMSTYLTAQWLIVRELVAVAGEESPERPSSEGVQDSR